MAAKPIELIKGDLNGEPYEYSKVQKTDLMLDFRTDAGWKKAFPWLRDGVLREYVLETLLGRGAFSFAFKARVRNKKGFYKKPVVVKFPYVNPASQRPEYWKHFILESYQKEFSLIARKLEGCKHANPVIDLISGVPPICYTVQPFLESSINLESWLQGKLHTKISRVGGKLEKGWGGIQEKDDYVSIALAVAEAIADVHLHRVTHADLHPGNIYVTKDGRPVVTLIDFGESFPAIPGQYHRTRTPKAYLSPERLGPKFPLDDSVDVYSFGILMLYLATGEERSIEPKTPGEDRMSVDAHLLENRKLIKSAPRIVDLVARCVSAEPGDRPSFVDICEDLRRLKARQTKSVTSKILRLALASSSERFPDSDKTADLPYHPILLRIVQRSMMELDAIIGGLRTDMVERNGTRDETLRVLVQLLDSLKEGDSWTSVTTLSVWQRKALGLSGSYMSANFDALNRGVSVRRIFVVSVEELGEPFCRKLAGTLKATRRKSLAMLARQIADSINGFDGYRERVGKGRRVFKTPRGSYAIWHRARLEKLLNQLNRMMGRWNITQDLIAKPDAHEEYHLNGPAESKGFYLGFRFVATLDDVGALREKNPATLIHFSHADKPVHRWVLVTTKIGNRASRGEKQDEFERPQLLGLRVFKSAGSDGGEPERRIASLHELLNGSEAESPMHISISVTEDFKPFHDAVCRAMGRERP